MMIVVAVVDQQIITIGAIEEDRNIIKFNQKLKGN